MLTPLVLDIETSGDSLLAVGWRLGNVRQVEPMLTDPLWRLLRDPEQVVVTHTSFDLRWLRLNAGVDTACVLHDTKVMAWLINETTPLDLESLAARYIGLTMDKRIEGKGRKFRCDDGTLVDLSDAPWDQLSEYCGRDVDATYRLYHALIERLEDERLLEYFLMTEAPFSRVLLDMECEGLPVDLIATEKLADHYRKKREALAASLTQGLPMVFNLRSPQHVGKYLGSKRFYLRDRLVRTTERDDEKLLAQLADIGYGNLDDAPPGTFVTKNEGRTYDHGVWVCEGIGDGVDEQLPSVNRSALQMSRTLSQNQWVQRYLTWKKLDKLLATYLEMFPRVAKDGRIYARFNQTGTTTGRLSSSDPNLQNIPARGDVGSGMRTLFRGPLLVGDFSQLEPRLMAHFSKDPVMVDAFLKDKDIYQTTADLVGCTRFIAKVLVLAMGYGAGANKLAEILTVAGVPTPPHVATDLLTATKTAYSTYFEWRERIIQQAKTLGYVSTLDGRRRHIHFGWTYKHGGEGERQAANAVVQGSAADVVRRVMLHTSRLFPNLHLVAQVHDELVWEYDPKDGSPNIPELRTWVERFAGSGISVPLKFEPHVGASWYTAKAGTSDDDAILATAMAAF